MIEKLDVMLEDFVSQKDEDKYRWIARFRKYLSKNEELRAEYHHPLFIVMIEYHISEMKAERQILQSTMTTLLDRELDGIDNQPFRYFEGGKYVQGKIAERIEELDYFIEEYQAELKRRKQP